MRQSTRKSVNVRSKRPIVISGSSSPTTSAEIAPESLKRSSGRNRQQSSRTSMKSFSPEATLARRQATTDRGNIHTASASIPPQQAPRSDVPEEELLPDSSDDVEEYTFSSEDEDYNNADDDDFDDGHSHISVSSDDPPVDHDGIDPRPWRYMSQQQRMHYESMFVNVTSPAVGQSWSYTEDYQQQIDNTLLMYIQDFPLSSWVIGQEAAERAYHNYRERFRWRLLGIRIYGADKVPDIFQPRVSYAQSQPMQPVLQRTHTFPAAQSDVSAPSIHRPRAFHIGTTPAEETAPPKPRYSMVASKPMQETIDLISSSAPKSEDAQLTESHAHPPRPRQHPARSMRTVPASKKPKVPATSTDSPPPRPVTPPYPTRARPPERPKPPNKTGKRPARKPAEADVFPWNRDIDYRALTEAATWRMDVYDKKTLEIMAQVRKHNGPIIERLDHEVVEKQRIARNNKKARAATEGTADSPARPGRKKKDPNDKSDNSDPYHAGYFAFANDEMKERSTKLGHNTPYGLIAAGEADEITLEDLESVKICWNPGRKGLTYDLVQAPFSARDTVITRKQLASAQILTREAANCIIDFSPDLLWRDILLRICSEAGCGNKDVRDRFCLNGCHADKATFTKRISAALGQKQTQAKTKGYETGEWEFYEASGEDFKNYIEFFGKRATTRNMKVGLKRRLDSLAAESSGAEDDNVKDSSKMDDEDDAVETTLSLVQSEDVDMEDADEKDIGAQDDAVSLQDSDDLDRMSD